MISFKHEGKTYEVKAMTAFQAEMRNNYLVQLGRLLQTHLGLSDLDKLPSSMDRLTAYFVDWHLCTTINGEKLNLVMFSEVEDLLHFFKMMGSDDELANKWHRAYKQANLTETTPSTEKNVPAPVSE